MNTGIDRPKIHLVSLNKYPILEQLQLEEALLRIDHRNFCIINSQLPKAIVLGISSKVDQMIDFSLLQKENIPLIRRFSGGGTVVLDENSIMVSFICNSKDLHVPCFPQAVFNWSETFYKSVFASLAFDLQENDYVIEKKKFGGNAQYMTKERWLHHTSFLWDYEEKYMNTLKQPPKMPEYRKNRSHNDFLCKLKDYLESQAALHEKINDSLSQFFQVDYVSDLGEIEEILKKPHRKATVVL